MWMHQKPCFCLAVLYLFTYLFIHLFIFCADRLLSLGQEERRKEYGENYVPLDKIPTWRHYHSRGKAVQVRGLIWKKRIIHCLIHCTAKLKPTE